MTTSSAVESQVAWDSIVTHLSRWFHEPDFEALRIIYAACAAHYLYATDPVWPMVIAPPSCGKTSIAVAPIMGLPSATLLGDLSPKTLLSGRRGKQCSLLHRVGNGILVMKDFGTILSKREQDRNEVMGQLREVYDGELSKQGGDGFTAPWKGKITIVAAATQAIDRTWSFQHDLGERFSSLRWRSGKSFDAGMSALRQVGHEREIREETERLVRAFIVGRVSSVPPPLSETLSHKLTEIAHAVACARASVVRDSWGNRNIIEIGEPEGITRLQKVMSTVIRFHSALFGRTEPIEDDLALARRMATDAIRPGRWKLIQAIPSGSDISWADLHRKSGIPPGSIEWISDELAALKLIDKQEEVEWRYSLTPDFDALLIRAGLR